MNGHTTAPAASGAPLLEISDIHLAFGGVNAINGASMVVQPGELTAIIGPNGAGKTSLLNCINGFYRPQRGSLRVNGHNIARTPPHRIATLGVARTFQNVEVLGKDTVFDNILLGRHIHIRHGVLAGAFYIGSASTEERRQREQVREIADFLGLGPDLEQRAGDLPYGRQKLVEIGRALAMEPRLLLLDEPTSGMTSIERQVVADTIRRIRRERGVTQLLIEHDMGFVNQLCERAVVMDAGAVIADGPPSVVLADPVVVSAYLGTGFAEDAAL